MDTLAGYIATLAVGAAGQYLSQFIKPKVKILYWLPHSFMYKIPNAQLGPPANPNAALPAPAGHQPTPQPQPHFLLLSQSITIQNFGRECAEWVEIAHRQKPDFFQLDPPLNFTEATTPSGEHHVRVQSLASKQFFTIQFLSYTHAPELAFIRSPAGYADQMPWWTVRRFPSWVNALLGFLVIAGACFCAYWILKGGHFVLKSVGAF
jgi:hypothetical protein